MAVRSPRDTSVLAKRAGSGNGQTWPPAKAKEDATENFCPKPRLFCRLKQMFPNARVHGEKRKSASETSSCFWSAHWWIYICMYVCMYCNELEESVLTPFWETGHIKRSGLVAPGAACISQTNEGRLRRLYPLAVESADQHAPKKDFLCIYFPNRNIRFQKGAFFFFFNFYVILEHSWWTMLC